eukprot:scaffold8850_cov134-Isochrysis_galbana.AAC.24
MVGERPGEDVVHGVPLLDGPAEALPVAPGRTDRQVGVGCGVDAHRETRKLQVSPRAPRPTAFCLGVRRHGRVRI